MPSLPRRTWHRLFGHPLEQVRFVWNGEWHGENVVFFADKASRCSCGHVPSEVKVGIERLEVRA